MSQQDPYDAKRQQLANLTGGRIWKRSARISPDDVDDNTSLETAQETFFDPATQRFVTLEKSTHYLLACGCRVSAPNQVRGICPACFRSLRVRLTGRMRLICNQHVMCLRCRMKRRRQLEGGGFWRTALAIVLWPLFDIDYDDDLPPPPPPPNFPSQGGPYGNGGSHAGPL